MQLFNFEDLFKFKMNHTTSYGVDYSFIFNDLNRYFPIFDDLGVPVKEDLSYNISGICGYGLAYWNLYLDTSDEECRKKFNSQIEFLKKTTSFFYPSNLKLKGLSTPWFSCLYQGLAASMFLRSYLLTASEVDKNIARKCLDNILVKDYNLVSEFNNQLFLEEFPYENPSHVLNGFLSAYIAFLEYKNITKDSNFDLIIKSLTESLQFNLQFYSKRNWSLYEITTGTFKNYATVHYHTLHIAQLEYIKYLTNVNNFDYHIGIWKNSLFSLRLRFIAFLSKVFFRLHSKLQGL
jgi:hypothetical protein